jgi:hypothetical protein
MARVLVTGSRSWADAQLLEVALLSAWDEALQAGFDGIVVVEGEAEAGADPMARQWAEARGITVDRVPADWPGPCGSDCRPGHRRLRRGGGEYCPTAGHRRNQVMVDRGASVALAFLVPELPCRGTRDCMRRAQLAGIPVWSFLAPAVEGAQL